MAVRLHFIVEGQTEETFVNRVLRPYLATLSIWAKVRCVLTSRRHGVKYRGGISGYAQAESDIRAWMIEDQNSDARFTTMFDLYRLPTDFPNYKDAARIPDPYRRVTALEEALGEDIADQRFTEYSVMGLTSTPESATLFPVRRKERWQTCSAFSSSSQTSKPA